MNKKKAHETLLVNVSRPEMVACPTLAQSDWREGLLCHAWGFYLSCLGKPAWEESWYSGQEKADVKIGTVVEWSDKTQEPCSIWIFDKWWIMFGINLSQIPHRSYFYTKKVPIVHLKFKFPRCPVLLFVFLFAKCGTMERRCPRDGEVLPLSFWLCEVIDFFTEHFGISVTCAPTHSTPCSKSEVLSQAGRTQSQSHHHTNPKGTETERHMQI